jgi:Tat protein secretion system quality control protein TatD with DNase activity
LVHTISLSSSPVSKETHYRSLFDPSPNNEAIFSSLLHTLPDPTPLPTVLATLRANLTSFPSALLGEVGLDRTFRLPLSSPSEGARNRTPFTTPLAHQLVILEAQLELALELRRHMSMHSVRAQEATLELFDRMKTNWGERWESMSVDMHSCTLSVETWLAIEVCSPSLQFLLLEMNGSC